MSQALTIRGYLDAELGTTRVRDLEQLAAEFTGRPLAEIVADMRAVLAGGIGMEDFRRLHILISHLYHACSADIPLTSQLRVEANEALAQRGSTTAHPTEGAPHVVRQP